MNLCDMNWNNISTKAVRAFRGCGIDSDDGLNDEQDVKIIPLIGRVGIGDDDVVVNTYNGSLTYKAVAEGQSREFTELKTLL